MRFLVIQGPNLNKLGTREPTIYGQDSLETIHDSIRKKALDLGVEVNFCQSNEEGNLIDFLQKESSGSNGVIINAGALTHYGISLREALVDSGLPIIEVHLTNIHAREEWRHFSVIAPIARAQISGLGWFGYIAAMEYLMMIAIP